ncbi:hypothetical protein [Diplocloster hominis]|uniref:hypothetical protein n=1 Tax=Diplocloster hominis TaxID=3079010 RepID=UPI0031BA738A
MIAIDAETAVKFEGHDHEIGSLKHRVKELEADSKSLQELVLSVRELAINMEHMLTEQRQQGERLLTLESAPANTCRLIRNSVITALAGGVVGAIITAVITLF